MKIGCITNQGNVRKDNQDSLLVRVGKYGKEDILLCMVADGMGGTQNGCLASEWLTKRANNWWNTELAELLEENDCLFQIANSLEKLIYDCSGEIIYLAAQQGVSTGSTVSMLFMLGKKCLVNHVGDSRIYLLRNDYCHQITQDHTWLQSQLDLGNNPYLDPDYARKKGAITNAVGVDDELFVDKMSMKAESKDVFLLCSDGFYNFGNVESELAQISRRENPQTVLEKWERQILTTKAKDNLSAILVYV